MKHPLETMTDEELEEIEIDWTQGVAENFERVKSAALAALEAANRRADEAEARMYSSQRIAIAAEAEIDTLRARVAELEAGGCARDQGTTQYCAEAVALQKRVAELEARGPLLVFDWAYDDPKTGHQLYARTPERAKELQARGVKLTPVYTLDAALKENSHDKG